MKTKHTPGPWQAEHRKGTDGMFRTEIFSEQYGGIATCYWTPKHCGNGVTETYREANARLIAAAPELYDALFAMVEEAEQMRDGDKCDHSVGVCWCDYFDKLGKAHAALVKAKGEET